MLELPAPLGRKADIREGAARFEIGEELQPLALVEPAAFRVLRTLDARERGQRLRKSIPPLRFVLKSKHVGSFRANSSLAQLQACVDANSCANAMPVEVL
jgi:hypothetical protein